mmetsp:Transcript_4730/g.12119  ORF Transcript_4730/g.12119 Transcript_4730/m.12119 type:complete len:161 (-) Transcript_4730:517-999(-)
MPTENRPVTARHYAKGNYRGRHEWENSGKVVGFGPQTAVYTPAVDKDSDPHDTGRTVFVKGGKEIVHTGHRTSDPITADTDPTATPPLTKALPQVSRWREPAVKEAKVEEFNPWQTSTKSQFVNPAELPPTPREVIKPYFSSSKFSTMDNATGRVNYVAK